MASTAPSPVLAIPVARPLSTARAASTASAGSDLPACRRARRLGRSTSITSSPQPRRKRARPAPYAPVPSTPTRSMSPKRIIQSCSSVNPAGVVGNDSTPSTPPVPSRTAATWVSRCVSTPPVTGHVTSTMAISPSLLSLKWSRGGTHVPGRRPCRACCWRSELGHPPERGVPRFGPTAPVDTHLTNLGATTSQTRPQEPLNVATRTNALVDHQRHNPSLTGRYALQPFGFGLSAEEGLGDPAPHLATPRLGPDALGFGRSHGSCLWGSVVPAPQASTPTTAAPGEP